MRTIKYKILSFPFQIANLLIDFIYRSGIKRTFKIDLPVISIGNISFGGEGKTPLTINLSQFFLERGIKPAVLLRGYKGRKEKTGEIVSNGENIKGDWEEIGDEAFLISKNVPSSIVIIGKNRVKSALKALDMGAKIIILDDGFQYRKIFRNIDIVLYSPLPTFQREFFSSISRANIVLINEGFMEEKIIGKIKKLRKDLSIFQFRVKNYGIFDKYGSRLDLKNENVIAFCGIAKPFRFLKSLESLSIKPERVLFFPDHHRFDLKDIKRIEKEAEKSRVEIAITTEKDFIRLSKLPISIKIVYSKIGMEIEENFYNYILEKLKL